MGSLRKGRSAAMASTWLGSALRSGLLTVMKCDASYSVVVLIIDAHLCFLEELGCCVVGWNQQIIHSLLTGNEM